MAPVLDWGDRSHYERTRTLACCLCGKPTPMRSHAGEPVHKVCAETWNDTHPTESRRYTLPTRRRPVQHEAGTWRFHNDGPTTDQRRPALNPKTPTDSPPTPVEQGQRGLFAA